MDIPLLRRAALATLLLAAPALPASAQQAQLMAYNSAANELILNAGAAWGQDTVFAASNGLISIPLSGRQLPLVLSVFAPGYETQNYAVERILATATVISLRPTGQQLQEQVVTGLSAPEDITRALANYRIISRDAAQRQGAVTLADALATQSNITIANDGILGATTQLLGLSGDKVKVLIDGLPLNGRENGNIDLGQISLHNVARIEIVQGPMSTVYGTDAVGGVINLITKKPKGIWSAGAELNYESTGRYNAALNASRAFGTRHQLAFGGGRNFFDGWKYTDTAMPHRRFLFKPKEQYFGNVTYTYTAPSGFRIAAGGDLLRETVTNKGEAYITPYAGYAWDEYYNTQRGSARLALDGRLGKGLWNISNGYACYNRTRQRLQKDLVTLQEHPTNGTGDQDTSAFKDLTLRGSYSSNAAAQLRFTAGYDALLQSGKSNKIPGGAITASDLAAYATATLTAANGRLSAQPGLRASANSRFATPLIPSIYLLYRAGDAWQLRASYARGFRAPTLKEQYLQFIDQNHNITGNPDLLPEHSHHVQASVMRRHTEGQNYLTGTLTGFYNDVHRGIVLVNQRPTDSLSSDYRYANFSRLRNLIGTLLLEGKTGRLNGSAAYSEIHQRPDSAYYPAFVTHEVTVNAAYIFPKQAMYFSLFYKWNGAQPGLSENADGTATFRGMLPAYSMMDASISKSFRKESIRIIVGVKNLLDVQQVSPDGSSLTATQAGGHAGSTAGSSFIGRRLFTTLIVQL